MEAVESVHPGGRQHPRVGVTKRTAAGDMKRFKEFIEECQASTGAWRGEIADSRQQLS
jgi:hypothetical protein